MAHISAEMALEKLMSGNQRYMSGEPLYPNQTLRHRQELVYRQEPFAAILGCSDSRVPLEIIFDQGIGDLFVVRVAGNVLDNAVLGSLEFAAEYLKTPLIMVLGHKLCGAITASVKAFSTNDIPPGHIHFLTSAIRTTVAEVCDHPGDLIDNVVRANVQQQVRQLVQSGPILPELVQSRRLMIVGACYDLANGKVDLLPAADAG